MKTIYMLMRLRKPLLDTNGRLYAYDDPEIAEIERKKSILGTKVMSVKILEVE